MVVSEFTPEGWRIDEDYHLKGLELDAIVAGTHEMFIGVYDAESHLLWTQDPTVLEFYRASFCAKCV